MSDSDRKQDPVDPAVPKAKSPWNSLEVWKLIVSALTPVLLFVFGVVVTIKTGERERSFQAATQRQALATAGYIRLMDKRIELWDRLFPKVNYLMGKMWRTGSFEGPYDASQFDVTIDEAREIVDAYQSYFSPAFMQAIERFNGAARQYWRERRRLTGTVPPADLRNRLRREIGNADRAHGNLRVAVARELAFANGIPEPSPR